ncbi:MAG TPA: VIT1/CCC1 transporter family protein [Candidatus Bathyarchaeia archaeon]|nr:VIT1/CCC1 transporter family protein [Candidatus Bathyarchaeia archaeon]
MDWKEAKLDTATAADRGRSEERHAHIRARNLIADSALGLSDGLITNLSFLTGFSGAISNISLIRLAGTAAMLAGSVSMFFGGILAARSEKDLYLADAKREAYEIEHEPEEERIELKTFYRNKGLSNTEAEMVVNKVTSTPKGWLEDLLIHELHIHKGELSNQYKKGGTIGISFLIGALVPLLPYYLFAVKHESLLTSLLTSLSFLFVVGAWKGNIVKKNIWRSGIEMLLVGIAGSLTLYIIGTFLGFI